MYETTSFKEQHIGQPKKDSPTTKAGDQEADFCKLLASQLPERTMAALRVAGTFDTPPRHQAGRTTNHALLMLIPRRQSIWISESVYVSNNIRSSTSSNSNVCNSTETEFTTTTVNAG
jgi:hypothetical protein